jgi:alkanesulfonate monooxygenase SsuD/methylene tetrahydromethanopterin reductase-like flavin-dependent oxidoreductase (luciferase family)
MNWNPFRKAVAALPDEPTDSDLAAVFGQLVEAKGDNNPDPTPNPKPPTTPPPPPPASFAESPEGRAMAAEIAELKRKATEREAAERASRAATFAEVAKSTGRITPALEADLSALFNQVLADDAAHQAKVTFSEGSATKQGSRLDALVAFVAKLPKHRLTEDLIDPKGQVEPGVSALFNRSDKDPAAEQDADIQRRLDRLYPHLANGAAR